MDYGLLLQGHSSDRDEVQEEAKHKRIKAEAEKEPSQPMTPFSWIAVFLINGDFKHRPERSDNPKEALSFLSGTACPICSARKVTKKDAKHKDHQKQIEIKRPSKVNIITVTSARWDSGDRVGARSMTSATNIFLPIFTGSQDSQSIRAGCIAISAS